MRENGRTESGIALRAAGDKLLKTMRTQIGADPLAWSTSMDLLPKTRPARPSGTGTRHFSLMMNWAIPLTTSGAIPA